MTFPLAPVHLVCSWGDKDIRFTGVLLIMVIYYPHGTEILKIAPAPLFILFAVLSYLCESWRVLNR